MAEYGTQYDDVDVICPFYIASSRKSKTIICEGPVIRTKNILRFGRRAEHGEYKETYCNRHYKGCAICQAAQKKYDELDR